MPCCCGLAYVAGYPPDEERHQKDHDAWANCPQLDELAAVPRAPLLGDISLILVDSSLPETTRTRLAAAAMVGLHETPGGKAGYYGELTEGDEAMFLAERGGRVVGFALTALDEPFWRMSWQALDLPILLHPEPVFGIRRKIGRVWVADTFRRQGVARALLLAVAVAYSTEFPEMGWELPLTSSGRRMLARLIPGGWFARGDPFALDRTLHPIGAA